MLDKQPEQNKVDETTNPEAGQEKQNANDSQLDSDKSKNVEDLERELEQERKLKSEALKTLEKAEHTIIGLKKDKKEPEIDFDAVKKDVREDVLKEIDNILRPKMEEVAENVSLRRENEELKAALGSKNSQSASGDIPSEKKPREKKIQATEEDIRTANKYFGGDVERYMKYKV